MNMHIHQTGQHVRPAPIYNRGFRWIADPIIGSNFSDFPVADDHCLVHQDSIRINRDHINVEELYDADGLFVFQRSLESPENQKSNDDDGVDSKFSYHLERFSLPDGLLGYAHWQFREK